MPILSLKYTKIKISPELLKMHRIPACLPVWDLEQVGGVVEEKGFGVALQGSGRVPGVKGAVKVEFAPPPQYGYNFGENQQ